MGGKSFKRKKKLGGAKEKIKFHKKMKLGGRGNFGFREWGENKIAKKTKIRAKKKV